ncbi:hypothetical protein Mgra_00000556 [Meloidogyne graminicola]|uniref:Uncharacterized protein n=1 Tax=Meloidogyne graminicola TaxID=189291 RepID=A0A8T0A3H9_9BILA|nr:hypothetical protein Mgra_00000556 [Meloidogyne graminicola]
MQQHQILISFILLINLFIFSLASNVRVRPEKVIALTAQEELVMPETVINQRKKRLSSLVKGAAVGALIGLGAAGAHKLYKNYQKSQQQQAAGTAGK